MADMDGAACKGLDPRVFYEEAWSDLRGVARPEGLARARSICAGCGAFRACLEGALERREEDGIWAGTTPQERRRIRKLGLDKRAALKYAVSRTPRRSGPTKGTER